MKAKPTQCICAKAGFLRSVCRGSKECVPIENTVIEDKTLDYWQQNGLIKPDPWIVCAAIKKGDRIICGARHYDAIMRQQINASEGIGFWKKDVEQGFINQFGEFYTREQAWFFSHHNGQYKRKHAACHGRLFSEDLY